LACASTLFCFDQLNILSAALLLAHMRVSSG
jgi:hypothetical protein